MSKTIPIEERRVSINATVNPKIVKHMDSLRGSKTRSEAIEEALVEKYGDD